ncbi:beta-ketoacyl synthase domain-containing protein [Diplocarpon mali]|nr:beta-ketoacyl synthase domain-containing protein [Diplocarpon mali]
MTTRRAPRPQRPTKQKRTVGTPSFLLPKARRPSVKANTNRPKMANPVDDNPRPAALPITKTCVYKSVGKTHIPLDVYVPATSSSSTAKQPSPPHGRSHPVMLFIHGGGWLGSNRSDYCRPLFYQFLQLGFVVVSMDYRLCPETSLDGQLSDVRDVEGWLRTSLAAELADSRVLVDAAQLVVVGASAGAHLALLTPKLWSVAPKAILSMYGPTNLHHLPYLHRFVANPGSTRMFWLPRLISSCVDVSRPRLPHPRETTTRDPKSMLVDMRHDTADSLPVPCTAEVLAAATTYDNPPTDTPLPKSARDCIRPRQIMAMNIFQRSLVAEFLLKGLVRMDDGSLRLPEQGCVSKEEVDAISPLHLCTLIPYPPVYQIMGSADDTFGTSHVHSLHTALLAQRVPAEKALVPNAKHAFDSAAAVDGDIHRNFVVPAAAWVASFVGL